MHDFVHLSVPIGQSLILCASCLYLAVQTEGAEPRVIPAHRLPLAVSSPLFETMLYRSATDVAGPRLSVRILDTSVDIFLTLLKAVYTDVVDVDAMNLPSLIEVGKKYQIEKILDACATFLKEDVKYAHFILLDLISWLCPLPQSSMSSSSAFLCQHGQCVPDL